MPPAALPGDHFVETRALPWTCQGLWPLDPFRRYAGEELADLELVGRELGGYRLYGVRKSSGGALFALTGRKAPRPNLHGQ